MRRHGRGSSPNAACWSSRNLILLHETEKTHIAVTALRLPAGDGRTRVCVAFMQVRRDEARAAHVCCHHCQHGADTSDGTASLKATCCGNHHSTEINLYTFSQDSENRPVVWLPTCARAGGRGSGACRHLARRGETVGRCAPSSNGAMSAARDSAPLPYWLKTLLGRMLRASSGISFNQ